MLPDTTPTGVSQTAAPANISSEDRFQGLWDAGAFEPEKKTEAAPTQQAAQQAQPEGQEQQKTQEGEQKEAEVEAKEYTNVEEYLKDNGIEPEAFQALPVTVKIDGETKQVPLSEVIKSFQLSGHVNNKSIELSNQQKQFEQEREAARGLYQQQLNQSVTLGKLALQQLHGEYAQINWENLKATDPVTWAVKSQEFQQKQALINQQLGSVQQLQQAELQKAQEETARALPAMREKMLEARPEWRDPKQFDQDRQAMASYGKKIGFTETELGNIFDHRYMQVLADAARYAALQASRPEALKRVRTAPLMAKPGTRTQVDPKQAAKQSALERFNKSPRDIDAQAAMFEALV